MSRYKQDMTTLLKHHQLSLEPICCNSCLILTSPLVDRRCWLVCTVVDFCSVKSANFHGICLV